MIKINYENKTFKVYENKDISNLLNKNFGIKLENYLYLNEYEILFLLSKNKIEVFKKNGKMENIQIQKLVKIDDKKNSVYLDLKKKGFIVKTGLKFGSDFRIYNKKTELTHSDYFVIVQSNKEKIDIKKFLSLNRISNSAKKKCFLLLLILNYL